MKPKVSRAVLLLLMLVCLAFSPAGSAGELTITRVFGPEVPTGPYKHPASMTELKNGDLLPGLLRRRGRVCDRHGRLRLSAQEGRDEMERSQADRPRPVPLGRQRRHLGGPRRLVWLFYVVRFGETWSTSRVQVKVSRDGAETWSDASVLSLDEGTWSATGRSS